MEKALRGGLSALHPNLPPAPRGRETCRFLGAPCREGHCAEAVGRVPGLCTPAPCVRACSPAPMCLGSSPLVSGIFRKGEKI